MCSPTSASPLAFLLLRRSQTREAVSVFRNRHRVLCLSSLYFIKHTQIFFNYLNSLTLLFNCPSNYPLNFNPSGTVANSLFSNSILSLARGEHGRSTLGLWESCRELNYLPNIRGSRDVLLPIAELWSIYFSRSNWGIVKRGTAAGKKLK